MLEEAAKSAVLEVVGNAVLGYSISPSIQAVTIGVGAGFLTLLMEYVNYLSENKSGEMEVLDYFEFKRGFIEFIGELMDENGDMFYVRYPMFNYESWFQKQSD